MRPVMLMILDGYGISEEKVGNATLLANTPNLNKIFKLCPTCKLGASGTVVGLPEGQMGNSEVGHMNIGAGRIIYQDLTKIDNAIKDGTFFKNEEFLNAIKNCKDHNSNLHIMGLLSDGGVHTHINHLIALLNLCKNCDFANVYIHCFMDGRDTSPTSGKDFLRFLQSKIDEFKVGHIATIMGRYYAMDRDNRWDRVEKAYNAIVKNIGIHYSSLDEAIEHLYDKTTDEFLEPIVLTDTVLKENDSVIYYNFRKDRARELTRSITDPNFNNFKTDYFKNYFVCFKEYDNTIVNTHIAFKEEKIENTLSEYLSKINIKQLKIAETEKYAHVTFFFNGGIEKQYPLEDRILIPSPKVATYDLKPEMSAIDITERLVYEIQNNDHDVIILNYANPDMLGHTGNIEATVKGLEILDQCVARVINEFVKKDGVILVTADHGNCEKMIDTKTGKPCTSHTTNLVYFSVINYNCQLKDGILSDIAPTILDILGVNKPVEMTGNSMIVK